MGSPEEPGFLRGQCTKQTFKKPAEQGMYTQGVTGQIQNAGQGSSCHIYLYKRRGFYPVPPPPQISRSQGEQTERRWLTFKDGEHKKCPDRLSNTILSQALIGGVVLARANWVDS